MDEVFTNPTGTAKMWKYGRIEPGMGQLLWRVWVKDPALRVKIERLKNVEKVGDESRFFNPHHRAWYFHIPAHMKARVAGILGITGVVDERRSIEAREAASAGWGDASRFAPKRRALRTQSKPRDLAYAGGEGR
jgi:hypothetical protein